MFLIEFYIQCVDEMLIRIFIKRVKNLFMQYHFLSNLPIQFLLKKLIVSIKTPLKYKFKTE